MSARNPLGELMASDVRGPYQLIKQLGGSVWKAHHPQLDKTVAIKFLPPGAAQDRVEQFMRAARAMAWLPHRNIIQAYELGSDGGGYYLAMEFVIGSTLTARLLDGMDDRLVGRIDAQLHEVRKLVASRGIIPRRLTPDNMLLDSNDNLKVTAAAWIGWQLSGDAQQ